MSESQSGQPFDPSFLHPAFQGGADVPFELSQEPVTPEGPHDEPPAHAPAYEHLGELPASYGTQSVYLVAYDPKQLFAYWDLDWAGAPTARYALRVCRADGQLETQLEISAADAGRYISIQQPGGTYYVEMGTRARDGAWQPTAHSPRVTMPPEGLSGELEPKFATLPFHLSFQRLLELIQNAMGTDEDLTEALSRLQQSKQPQVAALLGSLGHLSGEQLHTLETLLGKHLDVEGGASPAGGSETHFLRDRHEVAPVAAQGSEGRLAAGVGGSESLSSDAFGSENLSSGGFGSESLSSSSLGGAGLAAGALASGSEALSSGWVGGGLGGEALSSGSLGLGLSSENLSSSGFGSEAWRLAGVVQPSGGSDAFDAERAALFQRAMADNLDVLGSLFSAFGSPGASDGFSAGGW